MNTNLVAQLRILNICFERFFREAIFLEHLVISRIFPKIATAKAAQQQTSEISKSADPISAPTTKRKKFDV